MSKTSNTAVESEAVESAAAESTATQQDTAENPDVEYVDHAPLFRDGEKYKNPLNVTINGVKYSVPRGVPLRLPKVVAEVIDQSIAQDAYAAEVDRNMQKAQVTVF